MSAKPHQAPARRLTPQHEPLLRLLYELLREDHENRQPRDPLAERPRSPE